MTIYTHFNVDLDAVTSVWAARTFVPGTAGAEVKFVPANWDGSDMTDGDIAVDIAAGGKGVKGERDADGRVHSCFATLVAEHADPEDQAALASLVRFVDAQDASGSAVKAILEDGLELTCDSDMLPGDGVSVFECAFDGDRCNGATARVDGWDNVLPVLAATGINAVLRALQAMSPRDDATVLDRMSVIFDGMLQAGRARQRAEAEADRAEVLPGGKVAIVMNSREFATNGVLFERGVRVIIYVDGRNIGVIRHSDEKLRMDAPEIRAVVEAAGEEVGDGEGKWFAHPAGFLFCRGSRKAPANSPSVVDPHDLAEAAAKLLE